jgi:hypothetical protein
MFKRVTWFTVGVLTGVGASKWVERQARRRLARYLPAAQVGAGIEAAGRAREAAANKVSDIRHAVEGGRDAMAAREAALRRQLRLAGDEQPAPAPRAGPGGPRVVPLKRGLAP